MSDTTDRMSWIEQCLLMILFGQVINLLLLLVVFQRVYFQ